MRIISSNAYHKSEQRRNKTAKKELGNYQYLALLKWVAILYSSIVLSKVISDTLFLVAYLSYYYSSFYFYDKTTLT